MGRRRLRARGMRRWQMCTEERVALTKMTDDNLAMVFAPNLLRCPSQVTSLTSLPSPSTPLPLPFPSPVSVVLPSAIPLLSMLVRQFST